MQIQYIDTPEQLLKFCDEIKSAQWLALDTEFLREKTYFPKFCLLQIATPEVVACIDPLSLESLQPLLDIIYDPAIIKVFHSARQDLEIFYHLTGRVPVPVFDTQMAAPLLGFQENPGYAMLVSSLLNINLSKAHTRADWSLRPLSEGQITYAAEDVIYLVEIYQKIIKKLADLDRSDWLAQDFARLVSLDLYKPSPENAWLKIKGRKKLTNKQLSVMQALTQWREQTAISENRPRNWLLRDDLIIDLARLQPENQTEMIIIRNLHERTVKRYGQSLCKIIEVAKNQPPIKIQESGANPKKQQQQEAIIDLLAAVVRIRADENSLNPAMLATRKMLETLVLKRSDSTLIKGWRAAMVGNELVAILDGEKTMSIEGSEIVINS